jgi:Pyruvate/2-oxoacid:ferredoxin oxidoreductase delta subunit
MEAYSSLTQKLTGGESKMLNQIWSILANPEEAQVLDMLPMTAENIAEATQKNAEEVTSMLSGLFHKGVVFEGVKDGKTIYRMPRHIIQFHDASLLWPEAPLRLNDLWAQFMETEYRLMIEQMAALNMPSFMRVLPINETIEKKSQILAFEDAAQLLKKARIIAVTSCVCRKSVKKCDNPVEICLQINKGAEYNIKRGTGRQINLDEALDMLKLAEEKGLVHMTENLAEGSNVVCNCCPCCCEMLRNALIPATKSVVAPSRFMAKVDELTCTSCGDCAEICPMKAVSALSDAPALVNADLCIGCGVCAENCPTQSIMLLEVRPTDFIPKRP